MTKVCDGCEFLKNPTNQFLTTQNWTVGIGNNHAYLGRAYVTLRNHKGSLSSLTTQEWSEFQEIVQKLEKAYKQAFGAEPLNWGCFMNLAYGEEPFNPHVHWHIFPRYKTAPELDGVSYGDPLFGQFYDYKAERLVTAQVVEQIMLKLKAHLD